MNIPVISIIIATYNWSTALKLAIQSALEQTYADFEIIVIGDHCTDDSEEAVKSFNDKRISWVNLAENSGSQSIPNNKGILLSRGKYIAYLGQDDIWHPSHLDHLINYLEKAEADYACSLCLMIGPDNEETIHKDKLIITGFSPHTILPPSSLLVKKSVYDEIGLWQDFKTIHLPPDQDLQKKMLGKKFICSEQLTCFNFNSAWRLNSYRLKPIHQQENYLKKMINENDFIKKEVEALLKSEQFKNFNYSTSATLKEISEYVHMHPEILYPLESINDSSSLGLSVKRSRIYRGLEVIK